MNSQRNEPAHWLSARSNVEVNGARRQGALAARRNMGSRRCAARVPCRSASG